MYNNCSILALIPARGGSKGLKDKNIKPLNKKPLIAYTIQEAKKSAFIDRLILSSDEQKIISIAKKYECEVPFVRPSYLASDEASSVDVALHAIQNLEKEYDYLLLLQPTSPLRNTSDIDSCIKLCIDNKLDSSASFCVVDHNPFWMYKIDEHGKPTPFLTFQNEYSRRQDLPTLYRENGAVFFVKTDYIKNNRKFLSDSSIAYNMPLERSIDIDTYLDFKIAELLLSDSFNYSTAKTTKI